MPGPDQDTPSSPGTAIVVSDANVIKRGCVVELDVSAITTIRGLSDEDLERRRPFLTASDFPAVVGVDRYRTRGDVYLEKVGLAPPVLVREPMAIGLAAESMHKTLAECVLGGELSRQGCWCVKGKVGATLDFVNYEQGYLVQAKTRGSLAGQADGDETAPPTKDIIQVQVEMLCSGLDLAFLSYVLGGFGPLTYRMFRVERDQGTLDSLLAVGDEFMGYVARKEPPPDSTPTLDNLKRIARIESRIVAVDHGLVQTWLNARGLRLEAERAARKLKEAEEQALAEVLKADPQASLYRTAEGEVRVKSVSVGARLAAAYSYPRFDWTPLNGKGSK